MRYARVPDSQRPERTTGVRRSSLWDGVADVLRDGGTVRLQGVASRQAIATPLRMRGLPKVHIYKDGDDFIAWIF